MMPGRPLPLPRQGTLILLAGALALASPAFAAMNKPRAAAHKDAPPAAADFDKLSGAHARACDAPPDPRLAAMGAPAVRQCAWSGHLEMQYWPALTAPAGACLPPPALAWQRLASTVQSTPAPWNAAWNGQALVAGSDTLQQALALWRSADGNWSAVLWRWQPSIRPDTRAWQQSHWKDVAAAAQALGTAQAPASPLLQAWLDASAGAPRALDGDKWRWVAQHTCLTMQTSGVVQAQLHLPYSRDDARLEQRSAMQVQLARRFPEAEWLRPFTLLDPARPGARSGAKFIAVWREGAAVRGQLWIPLRDNGGILRAAIGSAPENTPAAHGEEAVKRRADLIEHALTDLAHAWEARHD